MPQLQFIDWSYSIKYLIIIFILFQIIIACYIIPTVHENYIIRNIPKKFNKEAELYKINYKI